jgi:hypothetical protein
VANQHLIKTPSFSAVGKFGLIQGRASRRVGGGGEGRRGWGSTSSLFGLAFARFRRMHFYPAPGRMALSFLEGLLMYRSIYDHIVHSVLGDVTQPTLMGQLVNTHFCQSSF